MSFKAFRIHQQEKGVSTGFEQMEVDDLTEGDVVVRVAYSGINFKDALAATGKAKILRVPDLNGGIDFSGTVESSENARFSVGDRVLVCGCGLSETRDGGYSEVARVPAGCVVPVPESLELRDVMAIGTAGFTAAIAMIRLEENGQSVTGRGADTDTMGASARAYVSALNKLLVKREKSAPEKMLAS